MVGSRRIVIEFLGKDRSAGATADKVEGRMSLMGGKLKKVGAVAAAGFAVAGVAAVKFGADAVGAASDLGETQSKVNQIFGKEGAAALDKFAASAARTMGQSKRQALDAAATFGIVGKSAGLGGHELVNFSGQMTRLASDMASFSNSTPQEAIDAIGAAMRGEAEPIRRFGVLLDDATLRSEALKMGLIKTTKDALTPQQKALAAQAAILAQTKDQQGDFMRTSGGLANQQRILAAQFENVKASIGAKLLPVAVKAFQFFNDDAIPVLRDVSAWLSEHLGPAFDDIGRIVERVTGGMNGDVSKNLGAISSTFSSVMSIWSTLWTRFGGFITTYVVSTFKNVFKAISGALQIISGVFKVFSSLLKGDWKGVWAGIKQILSGALTVMKAVIAQALNSIKLLWRVAWSAIKGIVGGAWDGIKSLVRSGASAVVDLIRSIPGRMKALAGVFKNAGVHLIRNFVDGLSNAGQFVSNIVGNVLSAVKGAINAALGKIESAISFNIDWPGPGSYSFNPSIPRLATGGIVRARRGGTLALLGEAGHDEAVVPLSGPNAPRGGGGTVVNINISGALDPNAVARQVQAMLLKIKRDTGLELGLA